MISCELQSNQAGRDGYTLLEVLIAIAVLSIGILAAADMQIGAARGGLTAQRTTDLTYIAALQMERIISQPYDDIVSTIPPANADWIDNDDDGVTDEADETAIRFESSWAVAQDQLLTDTKTVTLTLVDHLHGEDRQVVLTNIVALGQR